MAGICAGCIRCAYHYFIDSELPGDQSGDSKPDKKFENRVKSLAND
jgi:hypothetical protein